MARNIYPAAILLLTFLVFSSAAQDPLHLSSVEEIGQGFSSVPCRNKERLHGVQTLFEKMQAGAADITIQKAGTTENLVVRKQGRSEETIVIGAHYDFIETGCGAVDNWSGIVAIAHLYRTIRQSEPEKTVLFVAFGSEERGLLGSVAMVEAIPKTERSRYCAMINIDSLGMATPFALEQASSPKLMELAAESAKVLKLPFHSVAIPGTDADSSSFRRRDIPAVTLAGLSSDWDTILHTRKDQVDKVIAGNVYNGYRLALILWDRIERAPCAAYR